VGDLTDKMHEHMKTAKEAAEEKLEAAKSEFEKQKKEWMAKAEKAEALAKEAEALKTESKFLFPEEFAVMEQPSMLPYLAVPVAGSVFVFVVVASLAGRHMRRKNQNNHALMSIESDEEAANE